MAFDENKYKKIFESRYGSGSFDSGLSQARDIGRLKVQADFAQKDYMTRLKAAQAAAKKASTKKTYNDAIAYWNDPTNKANLQKDGAYRAAEKIKNDPNKQAEIKAQGYTVSDYINGMYHAASGGKYKSEREYNQFASQLNKDTKASNKAADKASINKTGMTVQDYWDQVQKPAQDAQKKAQQQQSKTTHPKGNPFLDALSLKTPLNWLDKNLIQPIEKNVTNRFATSAADQLAFGQLKKNVNKMPSDMTPQFVKDAAAPAQNNVQKTADVLGGLFGATAPIGGAYKLGTPIASALTKGVSNKLLNQAVRGGISMGIYGAANQGVDAAINPNDATLGQRALNVGENALFGAVADPALSFAGGKLASSALGQKIINMIRSKNQPTPELLGLPAPQLRLNAPQLQLPGPKPVVPSLEALNRLGRMPEGLQSPIPGMPKAMSEVLTRQKLESQGVGFGQGSRYAPKARPDLTPIESTIDPLKRDQSYWQSRYEDFVANVNKSYDMNRMTPEGLNQAWSQFAKYDEPVSLNQVVDLAYPKGFEAPPTPKVEAPKPEHPLIQALKNDPKINEKIKGFFPPVRPEPKVSRPATLQEMFQRLQELAPPKQTPAEPSPLNFRVPKGFNPKLEPKILNRTNASVKPSPKTSSKLAFPTILRSVKTKKTVNSMSKEELQTVYKQLEDKHSSLSKGKGNEQKLAAVQEDMGRVKKFLDLQFFGEKAPKETPIPKPKSTTINPAPKGETVSASKTKAENISPAPKGKNADITNPNPIDEHGYGLIDTQALSSGTVKTLQETKDILPNQTLTKNIYELVDRLPKEIGNKIKSSLDTAKANHVNNLEQRSTDLYNKVVKGLGIKKGSKESALVQDFGEKTLAKNFLEKRGIDPSKLSEQELNNINLIQLKKNSPNDWGKIQQADTYFKENYKKMIDEVNKTVKEIYPNNPDKIVPERTDYYHHFNELTGFEGFKNLIQNSSAIDPHLAGISPNTKPNSKWQAFKQMRGNGSYKSDAVGGYLKYLQAASHSTHIDPMIKVLRQSADQIATATEGTKNLNNLKAALEVHADNLAGKTNPIDRLFQDHIIGRKNMQIVNVINGHIKKNLILGNLGSALGQVGNVPLAIGKAKLHAPQGLTDTLAYAANHLLGGEKNLSVPIAQSKFLKERFSGKYFTRFDNGFLKKPEKMAAWLLETADKSGTYFTWNSMYRKGLAKGVANPIKYADNETRHIIAGRGVGEVPIAQRAKITQLVAPFTLEVGNQWKVLGKQMSEKDFAGGITFLAASYGLNTVMNQIKGSGVSYNPVGASAEGYNQADGSTLNKLKGAGASLLGETVGNIPGGNYIPQILGLKSPTAKQALFGNRSPDRFGTGVGVTSTVFKPFADLIGGQGVEQFAKDLLPIVSPFGGNQIKKTVGGIKALAKDGSYDNKGNLQYPVNAGNKADLLHSLLLGPTTTANGQAYYDNNRKPLSDKQTMQYQNAPNKQDYYNNLMHQREINTIQMKIKGLQKDRTLTPQEKQQNLLILIKKLQNLQK